MVRLLEPRFVERVWGRHSLAPLFGEFDRKIGEVWFAASPDDPLLVKFIFTSERLSVQVHPDDAFARVHENSRGKTEMWHILAADEGATIGLGFRTEIDAETLRQAVADGTVQELVNWVPVKAGDAFFAPAGTVHALGAGLALCEVQQHSDITYRLYDYGRPRELHLEKGLQVAQTVPFDGRRELPLECAQFTTDLLDVGNRCVSDAPCSYLLVVLKGTGRIAEHRFQAGQVWEVAAEHGPLEIAADEPAQMLRTRCESANRTQDPPPIRGESHNSGR